MTRRHLAACALLLVALAGCGTGDGSPDGGGGGGAAAGGGGSGDGASGDGVTGARVVRVVDGDTLIARLGGAGPGGGGGGGGEERVRLLGVDAPESVTPDRPVECFGPQAAAELRRLLPEGTPVLLAVDPSQGREDRFGRLLAEVTREGAATTVNVQLVAEGFAEVFRGDGRGRLQPTLRSAERDARDARRGLWGSCRR
ncbi:thermonuclease family protein [Miltoncostaea oceani]|uniref:thermonuclease family protein n=1 Tax=Miltoncostaea oceani TaxID=2843216 RepID=UPI001C3E838A|nr:thermonuclease family protein [Miltoncostaea oceani]